MCVQYIGGYSVHRGDTMSTSRGYHVYIGGCSAHRGNIMSISGDIMSTSGGYHEHIGGGEGGIQYIGVFNRN